MAIAGLGVVVVLGGILWLRLHPLIALLLATLLLLVLTPEAAYLESALADAAIRVEQVQGRSVRLSRAPEAGSSYVRWPKGGAVSLEPFRFSPATEEPGASTKQGATGRPRFVALSNRNSTAVRLGAGMRVVTETAVARARREHRTRIGPRLGESLGRTFGRLGIAIVMAAVIGVCLLQSGGAARLALAISRAFGPRGALPAFAVSGFLLAIPVFFDTVFYLLLPLAKAHARQRPQEYLGVVMAVIVGAAMAHSLVPPTPGPLFVADALNVPVGVMVLVGGAVGLVAAASGVLFAMRCNRVLPLELPESERDEAASAGKQAEDRAPARPVSLGLAALPIALPVVLLSTAQLNKLSAGGDPDSGWWGALWAAAADPGLVLFLSALLSLNLLRGRQPGSEINRHLTRGMADAGMALLLICAGGAFGAAIKGLQIGGTIAESLPITQAPLGILVVAFAMTALLRGAQGSATVAMITAVSILGPLLETTPLPYHPAYLAVAIGCGSKPFPWMNDSGFWLITSMTGLTPAHALKTHSVALTLMGAVGFACCLLGAWLLPLT